MEEMEGMDDDAHGHCKTNNYIDTLPLEDEDQTMLFSDLEEAVVRHIDDQECDKLLSTMPASSKQQHQKQKQQQKLDATPMDGVVAPKKKTNKKKKKKRKNADDGLPKRPLSAYNLFFQAKREEMLSKLNTAKAESQNEHHADQDGDDDELMQMPQQMLGKLIGKQWRELKANEKKIFQDMEDRDCERYRREIEAMHHKNDQQRQVEEDVGDSAAQNTALVTPSNSPSHVPKNVNRVGNGNANTHAHAATDGEYRTATFPMVTPSSRQPLPPPTFPSEYGPTKQNHNSHVHVPHPGSWPFSFAMPPGMEIHLSPLNSKTNDIDANCRKRARRGDIDTVMDDGTDGVSRAQKFRVSYSCYSMSRAVANQYMDTFLTKGIHVASSSNHFSFKVDETPTLSSSTPLRPTRKDAAGPAVGGGMALEPTSFANV
jgi:hypothetical protein